MTRKPKVLFLCTGNSCRSQMAEALLRHHFAGRFEAYSAGTAPLPIHPLTLQVLAEQEVDTSALYSKHVSSLGDPAQFDYIITVCDRAARDCPALAAPNAVRESMFFEDPAAVEGSPEEHLAAFRQTRELIEVALLEWAGRR
jgi:arsenate reductase